MKMDCASRSTSSRRSRFALGRSLLVLLPAIVLGATAEAQVTVKGSDNGAVGDYYWTLEEDATYNVEPGVGDPSTLSVSFYTSHMPVVAAGESGEEGDDPFASIEAGKHYFLSVLPKGGGYSNGGARIAPGQTSVTVFVNKLPLPTAQITVFVFEDNQPINNAPDLPEEQGLAGFSVTIDEAAGNQITDVFGNPIGTTYRDCTPAEVTDHENGVEPDPCPLPKPDGSVGRTVAAMGNGRVLTDAQGRAVIKNIAPGKYGVQAIPPTGQNWVQTATIEGKKTIDAWVKSNEPPYFAEFGPPGYHAFIGFVRPMTAPPGTGSGSIKGQIVSLHLAAPPDYSFHAGEPFEHSFPWVGLNNLAAGEGEGIYAKRTNAQGSFDITGVGPGNYQLVAWDDNLDIIFAMHNVTIPATGTQAIDLGKVPVFNWFSELRNEIYVDTNGDGFRDPGETEGISDMAVNLRFRDGSVYQSLASNTQGVAYFHEVFPFFNWLVAEVDFARHKATGVTVVVDAGGPINKADPWSFGGRLTPQIQPDGLPYRTQTDPAHPAATLLQGFQGFIGQTSVMQWGKTAYPYPGDEDNAPYCQTWGDGSPGQPTNQCQDAGFPGPGDVNDGCYLPDDSPELCPQNTVFDHGNGGITGMVSYTTTRAENDPRFATAEPWEPGVPRVTVRLLDATGTQVLQEVETDSWDDNKPEGCEGPTFTFRGQVKDCFDGLRNWNQVRPAVFDGGYGFDSRAFRPNGNPGFDASGVRYPDAIDVPGIPPGDYVVQVIVPPGYVLQKEEDKNVDFGDSFFPAAVANRALETTPLTTPECVGTLRTVSGMFLDLFPGIEVDTTTLPDADSTIPGIQRPLCDRKAVLVRDGQNPAANFFLFTKAPVAGHIAGFILDDASNEFDPNSPMFGEKYAPPWLPISIRDWTGREVSRVYSDEFGVYNALVPSTYSLNIPAPSGVGPSMMTVCLNDPSIPTYGPDGSVTGFTSDPHFNPKYSQFCYTFQYFPGTTTHLDTPVLPVAAFAGPDQFPVDCEQPVPGLTAGVSNGTPTVYSVNKTTGGIGPYLPNLTGGPGTRTITILSVGTVPVPNPAYDGAGGTQPKTILRNFGFGAPTLSGNVDGRSAVLLTSSTGNITLNSSCTGSTPASAGCIVSWDPITIVARLPQSSSTFEAQLSVRRAGGGTTVGPATTAGITLTVGGPTPTTVPPGTKIQAVIDAASPGALILVPPGNYEELLVMSKPVRLQGWGAGSTRISAIKAPAEKLQAWRDKVQQLVTNTQYLLPGQAACTPGPGCYDGNEPIILFAEEGSGILVLGRSNAAAAVNRFRLFPSGPFAGRPNARIDGFTITGADHAGGIVVNGYAHYLEIGNNRLVNNNGVFGGGIRVGHATLTNAAVTDYQDAFNDNINIHHNVVTENAGVAEGGAGGGISLYTGSTGYRVTGNYLCGNFALGAGGGIGHEGLSNGGRIDGNVIVFNESFDQTTTVSGGGVYIGGAPPIGGTLTPGSGSVVVNGNLIHGNSASGGDGGGIRINRPNGRDVQARPSGLTPGLADAWYRIDLFNNVITNNVAALAGAGVSLQDATRVLIVHNTIAHNDNLSTAGEAFSAGNPNSSDPQPGAGIVSRRHSQTAAGVPGLIGIAGFSQTFSNPVLVNNIIRRNRKFSFVLDTTQSPPFYGLTPDVGAPVFDDLAVVGVAGQLNPQYCVLTSTAGYAATNTSLNPMFQVSDTDPLSPSFNNSRDLSVPADPFATGIEAPPAFDEGGNFIRPRFGPLTLVNPATGVPYSNYHVTVSRQGLTLLPGLFPFPYQPALLPIVLTPADLQLDYDRDGRPTFLAQPSIGADQLVNPVPASPLARSKP